ncbi:MAG: electron transfer flavoprotein subunit alpha/FixB family protein [Geobacter sp.]|nr:electron transfer flavoprotein subunit alpha/FixB family protein [Geobacter sp.]
MRSHGKILAFVDLPEGQLDETGKGLLSYAARLAAFTDMSWGAATLLAPEGETLAAFAAYGTPSVSIVAGGEKLLDRPVQLGQIAAQLATVKGASLLLLPHNDLGATLAPLLAASLDAALVTEVTTARQMNDGLQLSRQALGNRIAETRVWDGERRLVITVPVRALSQVLLPSVKPCQPQVNLWQPPALSADPSATVINRIPPDPQTVDLTDAEVIFSAGKGCDPATFKQLQELCRLLNVSFGVTRPVFDLGWTGFERMVGQTGRTVTPRLYLALGISGSMHHVGGIKDSRRIVSVNSDPKAPVFPNSDEGFVADLRDVIPRLLDKARAVYGGAA